jgi:predicted dehydrogenase
MNHYKAVIIGLTGIGAQRENRPATSIYGSIPQSHAAAYYHHPQTEVVAVCDLGPEMLERFRQTWQDVWPDLRYYTDAQAMLAAEQPDLVSIVTPDHRHADLTVAAAQAGAKAVLCEKPLATSLADADRMIAACAATGTLLSVEHTRRWWPLYRTARDLIRSGELGALRSMTVCMFSPRAMLFRNGAHMIDMLHFFVDSDVAWVWAELEAGFDHFDRYRGDGGHDPASEPAASGYLHFANGVRAFYESAKLPYPGSQFTLTCDQGRVELSDEACFVTRQDDEGRWVRSQLMPTELPMAGLLGAVDELITVLEQGGELISSGQSARRTVEVLLAMLRSHTLGNAPVHLPLVET